MDNFSKGFLPLAPVQLNLMANPFVMRSGSILLTHSWMLVPPMLDTRFIL